MEREGLQPQTFKHLKPSDRVYLQEFLPAPVTDDMADINYAKFQHIKEDVLGVRALKVTLKSTVQTATWVTSIAYVPAGQMPRVESLQKPGDWIPALVAHLKDTVFEQGALVLIEVTVPASHLWLVSEDRRRLRAKGHGPSDKYLETTGNSMAIALTGSLQLLDPNLRPQALKLYAEGGLNRNSPHLLEHLLLRAGSTTMRRRRHIASNTQSCVETSAVDVTDDGWQVNFCVKETNGATKAAKQLRQ
jgi:hypothetical protein